ncbi:MAG: hypothetical protein HQL25_05205 [Candidatus Omnitrophica bacterium]|nr:hypothetical protein [Candidatus Omnitrophota bacterium]
MKKIFFILTGITMLFNFNTSLVAKAQAQIAGAEQSERVRYFYDALVPYGEWIWNAQYGWVWSPYNVPIDWQPYTDGHWEYTDYGWTWTSDMPWGWACFHYGRWFYDDNYGWLWYPDTVWAPSWVAWRVSNDWIGWAPLPPEAIWREHMGLEFSDDDEDDFIPWHAFSFCHVNEFVERNIKHHLANRALTITIMKESSHVSHSVKFRNERVVNELPFEKQIVKVVGHPITPRKLVSVNTPEQHGIFGNEVRMFRPEFKVKSQEGKVSNTPRAVPLPLSEKQPEIRNLINQHQIEMQNLEKMHSERQKVLKEEHARELQNPPPGISREQLIEKHQTELKANQEQIQREQQLLQNWHNREERTYTVPNAPPHRAFTIKDEEDKKDKISE